MSTWKKESNPDIAVKIILFLLSPFFAFLYSLKNIKTRSSFVVFYLASIFFGISFNLDNITGQYIDGLAYKIRFDQYQLIQFNDFFNEFINFITFSETVRKDFYFETIAFIVSRFTDNYHVLFMVLSAIFSFFALKSYRFLVSRESFNNGLLSLILTYLFMFNQIFNINGVRFWTTAWIATYCILQIYINNNKKYYILAFLTPLFHGSFWFFILIILIANLSKRFESFWKFIFFLSFFLSNFALALLDSGGSVLEPYLPNVLLRYIDIYTSEEVIERRGNLASIIVFFRYLVTAYVVTLTIILMRNSKVVILSDNIRNFYRFYLVWISLSLLLLFIPSLGTRYMTIAYPFIAYLWLAFFKLKKYNLIIYILPIIFSLDIYQKLFLYSYVIEPSFFFSSPFLLVYKYLLSL